MYRGYFTDKAGRRRQNMGFYTLNRPTVRNNPNYPMVIVEARNKQSAANKIKKKYKFTVLAQNLRQVPMSKAHMMMLVEMKGV